MAAPSSNPLRLLNDLRVRAVLYQVVAVALVVGIGLYLFGNVSRKLAEQNIATGFAYLDRPAGFVISQSFIAYDSSNSYARALLVGILNTVFVSIFAVLLSTVLGLVVGIARLSRNPMLSLLAKLYVEALRNVPLLLYLFLWYALIVAVFPPVREAWQPIPEVFVSNGGLIVPSLRWSPAHSGVLLAALAGVVLAFVVAGRLRRHRVATGIERRAWPIVLAASLLPPLLAALLLQPDLVVNWPEKGRFRITGGLQVTPEFTALLVGLGLSASAGIAEIVRAGILSVGRGQWEASRSVGLRDGQTMRLVVLPQALRVIVPPLTSSYLSTFKNSSLAIAIGYPDLVMVSNTTMNQTGQAIEGIAIFMLVYLGMSITISLFMNWYNARVALVER
ncbi:MAG: ABC transporter permease subunit [Bosea sp. (in: a-proteobacteria)]|uniref:amino acid ABC transporter permease n=1 Tax=Bosea sp. (in: a-proteobacteria) TaxID=1871050 RepID=UPI0027341059|nr:ABC transporter permease subunit [Bosea sp. (in: a-proteobacteria)]MDP3255156.1 ABC transporter permease subunit [Bosea sp. (in: a-proteobacteria)]MDP3318620.1 ABC transporter permease subunit [Bosea sp. (in: a-proteobacteria)]